MEKQIYDDSIQIVHKVYEFELTTKEGAPILTCKRVLALYLSNTFFGFIGCSTIGHQKASS